MGFPVAQLVKNLPANAGDPRDMSSTPVLGRFPGGVNNSPLQYSCLENSKDCIVHGVTKSRTQLSDFQSAPYLLPLVGPYLLIHYLCSVFFLSHPQILEESSLSSFHFHRVKSPCDQNNFSYNRISGPLTNLATRPSFFNLDTFLFDCVPLKKGQSSLDLIIHICRD